MYEKVNPAHPDKVADRIAGAIVDLAYKATDNPHIAVEVLLGHGECVIIIETDVSGLRTADIDAVVERIAGTGYIAQINIVRQDAHLSRNQSGKRPKCGDNGIFKGTPTTKEQKELTALADKLYVEYKSDGKYVIANQRQIVGDMEHETTTNTTHVIICQSGANKSATRQIIKTARETISGERKSIKVNPLGAWSGGADVDTGATNRKLGSDMGDAVTGGGLHGKDLSKADVSVNIYAYLKAQQTGLTYQYHCAIGDGKVDGKPYSQIVKMAREYVQSIGGFEALAEWGLIRPTRKDVPDGALGADTGRIS